ncbi:uncharacterized protein LTR77_005787 [Saxophila tyrrhenica]|uniref:3-hydroxyisobutyrate dehydrogenase n=1 Tax=Saxophila tyrrhenica TaxID=1690608 RepID=A0AAV9PCY0_9PEZI|nr:hypothetical protein LTR77_005787 [Saxophila tyrrhenica]
MAPRYGFIGLGSMGFGMCLNIHSKIPSDSELYICDINRSALEKFVEETTGKAKVTILDTPKEITEHCMNQDIIITMLPKSEHVQHVYHASANNLLSASVQPTGQPKLFIECSTIDPVVSREVGQKVQDSSLGNYADAAVSGGPFGARSGTLSHMIGCDDAILDQVKSVVGMTGKSDGLFHCGPVGAGVTVKVINNYISVTNMLVASEGLNMGVKMGIDPKKLTDIINASSGMNWCTKNNNPVPGVQLDSVASRGYKGGFAIELAAGCIDLAVKGAEDVGAKLTLGKPMQATWHEAMEDPRCKGLDARSIYRWLGGEEA